MEQQTNIHQKGKSPPGYAPGQGRAYYLIPDFKPFAYQYNNTNNPEEFYQFYQYQYSNFYNN